MDLNKWLVSDLKTFLLQYNIDDTDIKGSGKHGNVIKKDYLKMVKKIISNELRNEEILNESNKKISNESKNKKSSNESLPFDMMHEIFYHADVSTIIQLCNTSTQYKQYCNDKFWHIIADREGLPIKTNVTDWIKEYIQHQKDLHILLNILKDHEIEIKYHNDQSHEPYKTVTVNQTTMIDTTNPYKPVKTTLSKEQLEKMLLYAIYGSNRIYYDFDINTRVPLLKKPIEQNIYYLSFAKLENHKRLLKYYLIIYNKYYYDLKFLQGIEEDKKTLEELNKRYGR